MPASYDLRCPIARSLEVVGDRWALLIVRDLFTDGPLRFQDLQRRLRGASPNTLSARLKALEAEGVVERRFYAQHPPRADYRLTAKGRSLGPVLKVLRDWGRHHAGLRAGR
jgi:DNA-binding HxlR family transcriptional regulator